MENTSSRDVLTKNVKKDRVMEALASEFECINYVVVGNVLREPSIRYRISKLLGECIPGWLREMSIYERFDLIKSTIVLEQEREAFSIKTKREVILENLRNRPMYFVNFKAKVFGKVHYYQIKFIADKTSVGKLVGYIAALRCIDDESLAERKTQDLQQVINAITGDYDTIVRYDFNSNKGDIFRSGHLVGATREEWRNSGSFDALMKLYAGRVVLAADRDDFLRQVKQDKLVAAIRSGKACTISTRYGDPAGPNWLGMKFVLHETAASKNCALIGIRDVTSEITEEQQRKAELEMQNKALQAARDAAQSASMAKSAFLFNMSHDIRTPMNAVLGFADKIEKYSDDAGKVREAVAKLKNSGTILLNIINEILELSRIESGKIEIEPVPCDVRSGISQLKDAVHPLIEKKLLGFVTEINVRDYFVRMDVARVNKIVFNILSNSIKYTPAGGKIWYRLDQVGSLPNGNVLYKWTIRDNGIGMDSAFVTHAFERFSREHSSTVSGIEGTGLGLSVCRELVEKMGGAININSERGKGTVVAFSLPLEKCTESDFPKPVEEEEVHQDTVVLEGRKVLLVDDNEMNREIAMDMLTDNGVIVETAENGFTAVEKVAAAKPGDFDLVLMDIQMPVMDGYEATRRIRALPNKALAGIPIVAMTANAFDEDRKASKAAGMNAHLAKPVGADVLCKVLSEFIGARSPK
jgi:signal transduction histidine kinase/ActR/RegA family two-component response regulator